MHQGPPRLLHKQVFLVTSICRDWVRSCFPTSHSLLWLKDKVSSEWLSAFVTIPGCQGRSKERQCVHHPALAISWLLFLDGWLDRFVAGGSDETKVPLCRNTFHDACPEAATFVDEQIPVACLFRNISSFKQFQNTPSRWIDYSSGQLHVIGQGL